MLIDVAKLVSAYHADVPDLTIAAQRVPFGTLSHRGSAFDRSFNAWHLLAIIQAICHGRFAARPSGTGDIYMMYAESFTSPAHLQDILTEAQVVADAVVAPERP